MYINRISKSGKRICLSRFFQPQISDLLSESDELKQPQHSRTIERGATFALNEDSSYHFGTSFAVGSSNRVTILL